MKSLPSRRFSRFGIARGAGRRGGSDTAAEQGGGGADTTVSASQSEVTSSPATILNDGVAASTITVTLRNAAGTPLSGKSVTLSSTGSNNTIVQPGTTNGSGVTTGTIASTTAEAKTVTAVSEGITVTDTATVTTQATVPPVFLSRYLTGLGTTLAAVRDTDEALPWSSVSHNNDVGQLEVVTVAWPDNITEALETIPPASHSGWAEPDATSIPICDVGESMFYRWYYELLVPDGLVDSDFHPIQCGPSAGSIEWAFYIESDAGTNEWRPAFYVNASVNSWPNYQFFGPILDKSTVYRIELQVASLTLTTFNLFPRIYDASGTLIAGPSAFNNSTSTGTLADEPTLTHLDRTRLALLQAGCNGVDAADTSAMGVPFSRMAKVAISHTNWCGPHGTVTGEA